MDWLSLFLVALIATVTYILAIQGLVSAMIMGGLVVLCTALSFAVYEWVGFSFLAGPLGDLALPVALMGTFLVPLLLLRLAMDTLITRSSLLPALVDRAGGTVFGFIAGYLMTGVLAVALQMVPFDGTLLGHVGFDPETGKENTLWFNPDRATVRYAAMMSEGLFSGSSHWFEDHPDLMQEIIWDQAAPRGVNRFAPPGAIRVLGIDEPDYVFDKKPGNARRNIPPDYTRKNAPSGSRWYLVRVALGDEARDSEEQHRFTRRQVRLVGRDRPGEPTRNLFPIAVNDDERPEMAVTITDGKLYRPNAGNQVDFVFEVPDTFVPRFIEYKMGARADLSNQPRLTRETPPEQTAESAPPAGERASASRSQTAPRSRAPSKPPGGRVSGVRGRGGRAAFSDALPRAMTTFDSIDLQRHGDAMVSGHIYGNAADQQAAGAAGGITRFAVPPDKRLFQLDVKALHARSTLGRALSFAVTSVKNYQLRDDSGRVYLVVGQIAQADVDGVKVIEVQYYPETVAAIGRGGLRDFKRIKQRHLRGRNYTLAFLFLVEPGARLTEFRTNPTRRATDLRPLNLVAPR